MINFKKLTSVTHTNENLKFCWEQYLKLIDILITLSTGTIIIISSIFISKDSKIYQPNQLYLIIGFIALVLGIALLVVWRILSQAFMEYQLLDDSRNELKITKLIERPYLYNKLIVLTMWSGGILLILSWTFIGTYIINDPHLQNQINSCYPFKV